MELKNVQDLFSLSIGDRVTKRNLFDLIQYSKVEGSPYWSGLEYIVNNTPQQGINWVGKPPEFQAVIIKTRKGSYEEDGWTDSDKTYYHYSFKSRNGEISYTEKANQVLIKQPQKLYPVFLFTEHAHGWVFEGTFSVSDIEKKYVVLHRGMDSTTKLSPPQDEQQYHEGELKYVTHLMAERSKGVVKALKEIQDWICEICGEDFLSKYHVKYVEAHHKIPISSFSSSYKVNIADFALLCPNCHKAVHIYMKKEGWDYPEIKKMFKKT